MSVGPQKITFAEMRASGVRGVLVYCSDYRCSRHIAISTAGFQLGQESRLIRGY